MSTLRSAWRSIIHHPLYLTLSTVTLGLGIGVCVSNFATLDALVLRPLLLPDVDRVIMIGRQQGGPNLGNISPADFYAFAERLTTVEHFGGFGVYDVNVSNDGAEPERLLAARVAGGFFETLGAQPLVGRFFLRDEDRPGRGRVVILSEGVWKSRYGADPGILSREIEIDGQAHQVVGVMPRELRVPPQSQIWIPGQFQPEVRQRHGDFFIQALGRLRPGATIATARAELTAIAARQSQKYPETHREFAASARPIVEEISGAETASYSWMLLASSLFLLLLACSNVANLHYARMTARSREFALRSALGASRWQVAGQLLSESTLLGLLGGVAGLCLGAWGVDLVRGSMPAAVEVFLPGWQRMAVNARVVIAAGAVSLLAGVLAGLASALSGLWAAPGDVLKDGGRGLAGGRSRHRVRNLLVVTQMVLSIVLLAGAGLTLRGFQRIGNPLIDGDPSRVLTMSVALPESRYATAADVRRFQRDLYGKLAALPGVATSAIARDVPYQGNRSRGELGFEGRPEPLDRAAQLVQRSEVSEGYFQSLGIRAVRGRLFTVADREESSRVAVVNEAFVRRYFPNGGNALGQRVRMGLGAGAERNPWIEIVGVSADIRHLPTDSLVEPMIYRPLDQAPPRFFTVVLRVPSGDPMALASPVRQILRELDRQQPISEARLLRTIISNGLTGYWYVATTMGAVGLLALVLSAVGMYSVMAFFVTERTHEIGIRMAMGADRGSVLAQVLGQGMKLVSVGLSIGLAATLVMARALASLLFGVSATDVVSLSGAVLVLVSAALIACWIPARRAASVDPMVALRHQ